MTPNERKIIKYLWATKGRAHIRVVSQNVGFTSDYTRLICRSLARGGYITFAGNSECCLLKRGRSRFESVKESKKKIRSRDAPVVSAFLFDGLPDASDGEKEKLASAGYKTVEDLAEAPISKLIQGIGVSLKKAADWINQARRLASSPSRSGQTGATHDKKVEGKK